ncbi:ATP-binding protein [Candidatus Zixiibacteriota bacterium]
MPARKTCEQIDIDTARIPLSEVAKAAHSALTPSGRGRDTDDVLAQMHQALAKIPIEASTGSRSPEAGSATADYIALLEVSKVINSTMVLDDILKIVMQRAIELLQAERGFLMLLDDNGKLSPRSAHNIHKESLSNAEDFRISRTVARQVAESGEAVYTSNAQEDERFANNKSVMELNLRSILCVPLKTKDRLIGVCYLDNRVATRPFVRDDLYLFNLLAEQAAIAIEKAKLYDDLKSLKVYNESIVKQTPAGIIVVDRSFRILTFNSMAETIFREPDSGWTGREIAENHTAFVEIIPRADRHWWEDTLSKVRETHQTQWKDSYFHNTSSKEKVLSIKISILDSAEGQDPDLIILVEDITEKSILQKYVIHSEKLVAKAESAGAIGHELNNYLALISHHAELLPIYIKRNQLEKLDGSCQGILDNIDKMKRFTDGLMDFSRMETELVEYDIRHLIEDQLFSLRPHRKYARVKFETIFDPELPLIKIDVGQIQQVLLNLINNAIEAVDPEIPSRPEIRIEVRHDRPHGYIVIAITDAGSGMPSEIAKKVFEPHFSTKSGGHGLGLYNCRKIIENHGGLITVESTPGVETSFVISLPVTNKYSSFDS